MIDNFIPRPIQGMDHFHPTLKVSDIITGNPRSWDITRMYTLLDQESVNEI